MRQSLDGCAQGCTGNIKITQHIAQKNRLIPEISRLTSLDLKKLR